MKIDYSKYILILFTCFSADLYAQKLRASFQPRDAIGIVGGYHFKSGHDVIELGLSRQLTAHGQSLAYAFSSELTKTPNNNNLFAFGLNGWFNNFAFCWLSGGLASAYYTDFGDYRAVSIRPMIGLGVVGFQVVYEYDLMVLNPNFENGGNSRLAFRFNLGLIELPD